MASNKRSDGTESLKLIAVRASENPAAHQAWADWRRDAFGCQFVPKAFSVPSIFPPTTQEGADAYAEILRILRGAIDWNTSNIPRHPRPWGQHYVSHETERP